MNVSLSLAKRKNMNGICLINQVRSRMFPYTSQIAEETSSFQLPFSKIKFNLLKILEASLEDTRAILVKLQAFIPQSNLFHPEIYYHIATLDSYF